MCDKIERIKEQLKKNNLILFVGAGVSATLGLPNWNDLISKIAKDLKYDPEIFKLHGDYLSLAEYYYIVKSGNIDILQNWMKNEWNISDEIIEKSNIYNYITELNCKLIYTTNYEHSLEKAFDLKSKKYKPIIDVSDLVDIDSETTQIIKFHGDMERDSHIVLSESDYFDRLDFETPLDIKLRSDMLGKSILFIGYSLSDINIRLLTYKLDTLWKKTNKLTLRPESFIFLATPNPIQEKIFKNRNITPIIGQNIDPCKSLEEFLESLVN